VEDSSGVLYLFLQLDYIHIYNKLFVDFALESFARKEIFLLDLMYLIMLATQKDSHTLRSARLCRLFDNCLSPGPASLSTSALDFLSAGSLHTGRSSVTNCPKSLYLCLNVVSGTWLRTINSSEFVNDL
jgi:hypothetical protein